MNIPKLLGAFAICFAVALAGNVVTQPGIDSWYQTINKPPITPPNSVFGPVWTILYILIAISLYLIWTAKADKKKKQKAQTVFYAQLLLNFLWSVAFFGLQQPLLGLIVIFVLWALIQKCIVLFAPISKKASYLLYPYLAWVSFAGVLNFSVAVLNF